MPLALAWTALDAARTLAAEARAALADGGERDRVPTLVDQRAAQVAALGAALEALRARPDLLTAPERARLIGALEVARAETRALEEAIAAVMADVRAELDGVRRAGDAGAAYGVAAGPTGAATFDRRVAG